MKGKEKKLYSESGSAGCASVLTSVKRLILLCVVPNVKESYENLKLLFELTNVNEILFKFVADFKVILLVNGQQTATATNPCPYCFTTLSDLKSQKGSIKGTKSSKFLNATKDGLKTFGDLKRCYRDFCSFKKDKKQAKICNSTVNESLILESDECYVLNKCIIPELHILQGFVNHLFWDGLVPLVGRESALVWPKKIHLVSKGYHGEVFEGNACRTLLKNTVSLIDEKIYVKIKR